MKKDRITISDIAREVGVSKATISRYLNGKFQYMSVETKHKIENVIKEFHYVPSSVAISLSKKRTRLIGIVVADIENPFSAATIKSISDYISTTDYNMIIADANNSLEREKEIVTSLVEQRVEAILINTASYNTEYLKKAVGDIPVVLLDRESFNESDFDVVCADNVTPIYAVVDHLFEMGYEEVHYFTEDYSYISTRRDRRISFLNRLNFYEIANPDRFSHTIDKSDFQKLEQVIKKIIDNSLGIPAIICCNGPSLLHVANVLKKMAVDIPSEIGLTGYDDFGNVSRIGWAEVTFSPLTTLVPNWYLLGKTAIETAISRINNSSKKPSKIMIDVPLIVRESTKLIEK